VREYAKVSPLFWTRGSGKRLRGDADAQVLALYLVTSPAANMIGVYYVPLVSICHETGLTEKRASLALAHLEAARFAFYDHDAELVWVPNMASYQIGDTMKSGDKRRGAVLAELDKLGDHPFVLRFAERYGLAYCLGGEWTQSRKVGAPVLEPETGQSGKTDVANMPHRRGIEGASKGHPDQTSTAGRGIRDPREEQEQEKEQEQETSRLRQGPVEEVWSAYVETLARYRPKRRPGGLTEKDRKAIKARLKEGFPLDDLKAAVRGLFISPFYLGQNERQTEYLELRHALNNIPSLAAVADDAEPRPVAKAPPPEELVDPAIIAEFERRMFGDDDKGAA
jgi:hypothetical protein